MAAAIESSDQDVKSPAPSHLNVDRVSKVSLSDVDYCSTRSHTQDNEIDTSTAERLGSDRIRVLEDHFQKNPKPGTEVKKRLAEQLELSLHRVNVRHIIQIMFRRPLLNFLELVSKSPSRSKSSKT